MTAPLVGQGSRVCRLNVMASRTITEQEPLPTSSIAARSGVGRLQPAGSRDRPPRSRCSAERRQTAPGAHGCRPSVPARRPSAAPGRHNPSPSGNRRALTKPEVVVDAKPRVRSASYLSPPDFHRLNWACMPIAQAFGNPPYLVGSVLTRPDFRDIDIRLILDDEAVERMFNSDGTYFNDGDPKSIRLLLQIALSDLIAKSANAPAPIDFQIQSMSEANVPEHGMRNPLGIRR